MEGNGNKVYFEAVGGDSRQVGSYTFVEGGSYTYIFIQLMYEPNDRELAWLDGHSSKYPVTPPLSPRTTSSRAALPSRTSAI